MRRLQTAGLRRFLIGAVAFPILFSSVLRSQSPAPAFRVVVGDDDSAAFSPNSDGRRDFIRVRLSGVSESLREPADWRMEIRNGAGEVVRIFVADRRQIRPARAINNLFLPDNESGRPLRLFDSLAWDGRDDTGSVVPDGFYQITVSVTSRAGGLIEAAPVPVRVDTEPPELDLKPRVSLLYREPGTPAVGSVLERLQIAQEVGGNPGTRYLARIIGPEGTVVRERAWEDPLPATIFIAWDEIPADEEAEKYGAYRYVMIAEDPAGNRARAEVYDLLLASFPTRLDLRAAEPGAYAFSPNGDRVRDELILRPAYISPAGDEIRRSARNMRDYDFEIFAAGAAPDDPPLYRETGSGAPPAELRWNGLTSGGDVVGDGRYFARLSVTDGAEVLRSMRKPVRVDTNDPSIGLSAAPTRFAPDGDGDRERSVLSFRGDDSSGIRDWSVRIVLAPRIGSDGDSARGIRRVYRTWRGGSFLPDRIEGDGRSDAGVQSESLERFFVEYEARDAAGNLRRGDPIPLRTSILFRPVRRGSANLVARLPHQNYFREDGRLNGAGEDALDDVLAAFTRYGRYDLIVESHAAGPGREEANLKKTELRARSMYRYLIGRGVPRSRLMYRGHGEAEPTLIPNPVRPSRFEHYRNERIEVRLRLRESKS